jgi:hypothetical protein
MQFGTPSSRNTDADVTDAIAAGAALDAAALQTLTGNEQVA